jgi:hypothetical protein
MQIKSMRWSTAALRAACDALPSLRTEELRRLVWAVVWMHLNPIQLVEKRFVRGCLARMKQLQLEVRYRAALHCFSFSCQDPN